MQLLVLLAVANLTVLALLGLALRRTSTALLARSALATVVVTSTPEPGPVPLPSPTPYGSGGALAYTLRRDGNSDIYAINQANREVVRLTGDPAEDRDPAWSPDGQLMAFASRRGGNWDVYLLDLEGGALIRLTRDPGFDAGPAWSPDGSQIAFESYRSGNLDVYVMDADGRNVRRMTSDPAPDYSPAWSPDGRMVAFVSYRDGSQDVFVHLVEGQEAGREINVTNSPDADESDPVWSPYGARLAYTIGRAGYSTVQVSALEWRTEEITQTQAALRTSSVDLFGSGHSPTWSPDGRGLVTVYQRAERSYLIASSLYSWGLSQEVYSDEALLDDPVWGTVPLSPRAIARARAAEPTGDASLFTEFLQAPPESGPPCQLVNLPDVNGGDDVAQLSDRADDSFKALRQRVLEDTGLDYLATLGSAVRSMYHTPRPGQSRMSWHVCGRAIDVDQSLYDQEDQLIHLVREDVGNETYWRVFLRAARQDGSMGEPLRVAPWDLKARQEGGTAGMQGGRLVEEVPPGYFVDLTTVMADYGWERVSALYRWRQFWPDIEWWHFQKSDGLSWWQCMLELYERDDVEAAFGPIPEEALAGPESPLPGPFPMSPETFELGGQVRDTNLPHSDLMHYAGMTWVKAQVRYGQDAAPVIRIAHGNGFKVLLSAVGSPEMVVRPDFEERSTRWLANLAAEGADAIEVWNEPNIDREWQAGYIDPAAYTRLLCAAYHAIKVANPETLVVSAAPAPTGAFGGCSRSGCDDLPFLQGMYNSGAIQCMDYIGAHSNAGATPPWATSGHPADDGRHHHSWYLLPQTQIYFNVFGGTRQLFYTELGYASQEGVATFPQDFAWARGNDNSEQAAWTAEAVRLSIQSGMVRCIIIWNVDFGASGRDPQVGYAIIRPDGSCPACDTLHEVLGTRRE